MTMRACLLISVWLLALAAQQGNLRQTYEQARMLDEKNTDLAEAIRHYGQVATEGRGERPLAARALYQKGIVHARLGQKQEAARCWRQVTTEFSDQLEMVRLARNKLNPAGTKLNGVALRRVLDAEGYARVSPNGRLLLFVDSDSGNIAVRDLTTGEQRNITHKKESWAQSKAQFLGGVFSANGGEVAYQWMDADGNCSIRIVRIEGAADRLVTRCPAGRFCQPVDWSEDGRTLLVELTVEDSNPGLATLDLRSAQMARIPLRRLLVGPALLARNEVGVVATLVQDDGAGSDIFHVGMDGTETPLVTHPASDSIVGFARANQLLFSSTRLGATSIWTFDPARRNAPLVVKQELGSVEPIGLTRGGSLFYYSPTGLVDVFLAEIDLSTGVLTSPPTPLMQRTNGRNIYPNWSPDGGRLLFLSLPTVGAPTFVIYDRGAKQFHEIANVLVGAQRPLWSPDGGSIFVAGTDSGGRKGHFLVDSSSGAMTLKFPFSLTESFLEGAWSPDGKYFFNRPNQWSDGIYRIDAGANEKKVLYVPPAGVSIGLENLTPSPDGRWLAFHATGVPRGGSSLMLISIEGGEARPLLSVKDPERFAFGAFSWAPDSKSILALRGPHRKPALWIVPMDGSPPRRTALDHPEMRMLRLNRDGKTLSFVAGARWAEIWALDNFLPETDKR